jgi:hypothetical protein
VPARRVCDVSLSHRPHPDCVTDRVVGCRNLVREARAFAGSVLRLFARVATAYQLSPGTWCTNPPRDEAFAPAHLAVRGSATDAGRRLARAAVTRRGQLCRPGPRASYVHVAADESCQSSPNFTLWKQQRWTSFSNVPTFLAA